jgi:DAACS family dicarboxylate/amino acid:cation (Na+ or H+) symporter
VTPWSLIIGLGLGLLAGPWAGPAAPLLSEISKWVIQLIKAVAVPLLFFAVVNAVHSSEVRLKSGVRMVGIAIVNAAIALGIGMALSHWLRPGDALRSLWSQTSPQPGGQPALIPSDLKLDWMKNLSSWIPASALGPFVENAVIPVIVLALLLGFALRGERQASGEPEAVRGIETLTGLLHAGQRVSERILFFITRAIPLAVFAAVASAVAKFGYGPLAGLFPYLGVALLGLSIHILFTYQAWIRLVCRRGLGVFWTEAKVPVIQSIGTNSSLATLPFTLRALDRLGVSRQASALGACVGTNLNNDGILLYEGMAFLTVAQALGMDLSIGQQLSAALLCMLTGMGVAGVPDAGFISLSLVLTTVGIPIENLPLLLSVDWILGRARSVTNVLSDMTLSIAIDGPRKRA